MSFRGDSARGDSARRDSAEPSGDRARVRARATTVRLVLAAAAIAMPGCGSAATSAPGSTSAPASQSTSGTSSASHRSSPIATYVSHGSGSDTAALQGKLVLDAGCLYIQAPDGTDWIAAFPVDEVEWEDGRLHYQGSSYGHGDEILLGGGTGNSLQGVTKPDSCRHAEVWQVGQTD